MASGLTGAEFRDATLLLNAKSDALFRPRMFFNLSVGFHGIPLTDQDRRQCKKDAAVGKLESFSLLLADIIKIPEAGAATTLEEKVLTRFDHSLTNVMWEIGEGGGPEDDSQEQVEVMDVDADENDFLSGGGDIKDRLRKTKEKEDEVSQTDIDKRMKQFLKKKMLERAAGGEDTGYQGEEQKDGDVEDLQAYRYVGVVVGRCLQGRFKVVVLQVYPGVPPRDETQPDLCGHGTGSCHLPYLRNARPFPHLNDQAGRAAGTRWGSLLPEGQLLHARSVLE
jgi:hypothetical protein